jgi:hypothetical protein
MSSLFDINMDKLLDEKFNRNSSNNQAIGSSYNNTIYYNSSSNSQYSSISTINIPLNNIPTWFSLNHCSS